MWRPQTTAAWKRIPPSYAVWSNLIDNALRHIAAQGDRRPFACVRPTVDGISRLRTKDRASRQATATKLLTRFSRADSARSPEDGGAGLGLALSAAIARAHGGTLELVLTKGPGAVFKLHVPNGEAGRPSPKPTPRL